MRDATAWFAYQEPHLRSALTKLGVQRVRWGAQAFQAAPSMNPFTCFCARAYATRVLWWRVPNFSRRAALGLTYWEHCALSAAYEYQPERLRAFVSEWLMDAGAIVPRRDGVPA